MQASTTATSTTLPLTKTNDDAAHKTELCKYYMKFGKCWNTRKGCNFAHGTIELRRHPKYKTIRCETFSKEGYCPYEDGCRFIHSTSNGGYKTQLCTFFMEAGSCRNGSECKFAHGNHELRRHSKYKTVRCEVFDATGYCKYEDNCRYIHTTNKKVPEPEALKLEKENSTFRNAAPPGLVIPETISEKISPIVTPKSFDNDLAAKATEIIPDSPMFVPPPSLQGNFGYSLFPNQHLSSDLANGISGGFGNNPEPSSSHDISISPPNSFSSSENLDDDDAAKAKALGAAIMSLSAEEKMKICSILLPNLKY